MIGNGDNSPKFTICPFCKHDLTSITVKDIISTDTGIGLTEKCKQRINISSDYNKQLGWNQKSINIKCLHESCPSCHGTGMKEDGSMCIHMISCPCKTCRVWC